MATQLVVIVTAAAAWGVLTAVEPERLWLARNWHIHSLDHHTLIVPNSEHEASMLYDIESRFDSQDAWPADPSRNEEARAAWASMD